MVVLSSLYCTDCSVDVGILHTYIELLYSSIPNGSWLIFIYDNNFDIP